MIHLNNIISCKTCIKYIENVWSVARDMRPEIKK